MPDDNQHDRNAIRGYSPALLLIFPQLTPKQHEVLRFISENRTSKEIAWQLGISESAVNQRIEGIRLRAGSPPRAELARAYRQYLEDLAEACNPLPDKNPQVPESAVAGSIESRDERTDPLALADSVTYTITAPWQRGAVGKVVPEVLDGANAGFSRTAAMVVIAAGILLAAMVGLGVVRALSDLI
jgi:DNA-binding CsgD family transcriptional regulator